MKLDKKQRTILRAMARGELFALISHCCQLKVEKMELWKWQETHGLISILEAEGTAMPNLTDGRSLRKTLARMNLSSLIALAMHQVNSPEAARRLSDAFETR